jgi:hypothetical protein
LSFRQQLPAAGLIFPSSKLLKLLKKLFRINPGQTPRRTPRVRPIFFPVGWRRMPLRCIATSGISPAAGRLLKNNSTKNLFFP